MTLRNIHGRNIQVHEFPHPVIEYTENPDLANIYKSTLPIEISCGMMIFTLDGKKRFLLLKHDNRYDIPKGHIEADETEFECALREMKEETGLKLKNIIVDINFRFTTFYLVNAKKTDADKALKKLTVFLAYTDSSAKIKVSEHVGFEWMDWKPPHKLQPNTIDPLLASLDDYFRNKSGLKKVGR